MLSQSLLKNLVRNFLFVPLNLLILMFILPVASLRLQSGSARRRRTGTARWQPRRRSPLDSLRLLLPLVAANFLCDVLAGLANCMALKLRIATASKSVLLPGVAMGGSNLMRMLCAPLQMILMMLLIMLLMALMLNFMNGIAETLLPQSPRRTLMKTLLP